MHFWALLSQFFAGLSKKRGLPSAPIRGGQEDETAGNEEVRITVLRTFKIRRNPSDRGHVYPLRERFTVMTRTTGR
jgi:hypothetical protein